MKQYITTLNTVSTNQSAKQCDDQPATCSNTKYASQPITNPDRNKHQRQTHRHSNSYSDVIVPFLPTLHYPDSKSNANCTANKYPDVHPKTRWQLLPHCGAIVALQINQTQQNVSQTIADLRPLLKKMIRKKEDKRETKKRKRTRKKKTRGGQRPQR